MLKKARLLTHPALAATSPARLESGKTASSLRDAPCSEQCHSFEADPRFTFHASRFTVLMSAERPMPLRFPIVLVLSIVCFAAPAWADFEAGGDAYNRGDYATALREWRPFAEQGDAQSQYNLGWLYFYGRGMPQDYAQARQWYEKAAAQGLASAQYNLGQLYANGQGVPQDYATARQWYEKAAAQGDTQSQSNLGWLYFYGRGVPQDYATARQWYEKAAAQGDTLAATNVGTMYLGGYGVPQDYLAALFWLRRAADHGIAMAQGKLGVMYQEGWGSTQDYVEAHKWYNLSAANGEKMGAEYRDALAKQMTPDQIAEAQKLAREWKPKGK